MHLLVEATLHLLYKKQLFIALLINLALVVIAVVPVLAGGPVSQRIRHPSMGVADAGAQAVASDASTAFHNPAGMTRIAGKELMLTGGAIYSNIKFDSDSSTPIPGGMAGTPVVLHLCLVNSMYIA